MGLAIVFCVVVLYAMASVGDKTTLRIGAFLPLTESKESPLNVIWSVPRAGDICQLAVEHVNNFSELLPNYTLQLVTNDTKCDFGLANYVMFQHVMEPTGQRPIVLIGEGCSVITSPLVETGKEWEVTQFNFLSPYPARTPKSTYYPLLPSFTEILNATILLMTELEWKQSAILHQSGTIFSGVVTNFTGTEDNVSSSSFLHERFQVTFQDMKSFIEKIKNSKKRILFGFFFENVANRVVCEAFLEGIKAPDYVWILPGWYSPKWYSPERYTSDSKRNCSISDMLEALDGHFTVDFIQTRSDWTVHTPVGKTVEEIANDWVSKTEETNDLKKAFSLYEAYGYDTVLSIAKMLQRIVKENPQVNLSQLNYSQLARLTRDLDFTFEGLTGPIKFDANFERHVDIEFKYVTNKASNITYHFFAKNKTLHRVSPPQWTTTDGKKPLDSPRNETTYEEQGSFIVASIFAGFGVVFAIIMLTFNEYHRDKRVIKLSSPRLNNLIAIGAIAIYLSVIMSGLDGDFFPINSQSLAFCYIYAILLAMGFTLTFGSMFAKTWRVNVIMKRSRHGQRNIKLTDHVLFAIVGVLLLVDSLLLALWFGLDPYEEEISVMKSTFKVVYLRDHCVSDNADRWTYIIMAYKSLLLAFGVFMAWETRKVKMVSLNDSKYITMSVYNTVFMSIVAFAFSFISDEGTAYILVSFTIIIAVTVVLCLVFIPKIYTLMVKGDQGIEQSNKMASAERRISDHTIAKKSDIRELHRQNKHLKQIIRMLLEQRNLSDEVIEQVQMELRSGSTTDAANGDPGSTDAVETEMKTKTDMESTCPGTSTEIHETQT